MDKTNYCNDALHNFYICLNDVIVLNLLKAIIVSFITRRTSILLPITDEHLGIGSLLSKKCCFVTSRVLLQKEPFEPKRLRNHVVGQEASNLCKIIVH